MTLVENSKKPLVIDLDHTLIRTDCLHEALVLFVKTFPFQAWKLLVWRAQGKAFMKAKLFATVMPNLLTFPINTAVEKYCETASAQGRPVIIATASPTPVAKILMSKFSWVTDVIGTTPEINLTGHHKAEAIRNYVGNAAYDFISDHKRDREAFESCEKGYIVADRMPTWANGLTCSVELIPTERSYKAFWKLLRPYQWVKNSLILFPMILAHYFYDTQLWIIGLLGVLSFSAIASAIYVLNDLIDLEYDRHHEKKKFRPLASGKVSIPFAFFSAVCLIMFGLGLAFSLEPLFGGIGLVYIALNIVYSGFLKRQPISDVFVLTGFYMIRLIAGSVLTFVPLSSWLLVFSFFLFLSLGILKRYSELFRLKAHNQLTSSGRGYHIDDLEIMLIFGVVCSFATTLVLGVYLDQEKTRNLYENNIALWGMVLVLNYWLMTLWFKANRGKGKDDPVVLLFTDPVTIGCLILSIGLFVLAI